MTRRRKIFVSSIYKRKIVTIDKDRQVSDFSSDVDGLWSVSGIRVDEKRKILWAATTAFPQMENFQKADDGKSGVFKYDLRTGKLLKKYLLSNEKAKHALGDLIIAKNGDVYASDSVSPNIYRIANGKDELEIFLTSDNFSSLQGLAFRGRKDFVRRRLFERHFQNRDERQKNRAGQTGRKHESDRDRRFVFSSRKSDRDSKRLSSASRRAFRSEQRFQPNHEKRNARSKSRRF